MFRYIIYLLLFLILVPMLRGVLGLVAKLLMTWAVGPSSSAAARRDPSAPPAAPGGATSLHKDPVCGVYVSEATAVSCRDGNQTLWFCSTDCLNKYRMSA
jgi:YHS domain-containing protein